jgi:hypothetical protein
MNAFKKTLLTAAMLASTGMLTGAHANTVDLFTDPALAANNRVRDETLASEGNACLSGGVNGTGCFMQYGGADILGGYRDLYVDQLQRYNGSTEGTTAMSAGGGLLSFSNTSNTRGIGVVQWDGGDNAATLDKTGLKDVSGTGLGANLVFQEGCGVAGCVQFIATVVQADAGFEYEITLWDMDGTGRTLSTLTLNPITSPYGSTYLFSWWNLADGIQFEDGLPFTITTLAAGTTVGLDFEKIGAMELKLNTGLTADHANLDLSLSSVRKDVPEPSALALVGIALLGLGLAGKGRKSAAKA